MKSISLTALALALSIIAAPTLASAQQLPTTSIVRTAPPEGREGLAAALVRVTSARAQALHVARVSGTPALSLRDLQLAVGCVGETEECLRSVTEQLEVDALLVPSIEEVSGEVVASLLYFVRSSGETKRVARRAQGEDAESVLLDGVDGMVRELFGLPEAEAGLHGGETGGGHTGAADEGGGFPIPIPAIVVAGVGVAALAVGGVFGGLSMGSQSEFEAASPTLTTDAEADALIDIHDRAARQAIIADVLFGVGGAALITAAVLWLVLGGDDGEAEPAVAVAPVLGSSYAGIALSGRIGGNL